jgi:hypothetical protein
MKNTKTKIILSTIIFLSVVGFVGILNAAGASLYVSPASITKTAGDTFSVSVGFNASGSKVCAAEGTLVFNNLSCQNITVAGDVTPQSSPTCSNPHFLIGVPSCTTADKVLFTVSVKAGSVGTASINLTGVDIIGEGVSVGSASISGNYTINAVPTLTPTLTPTPTPIPTPKPTQQVTQPTAQQVETPVQSTTPENNLPANVGAASVATTGSKWTNFLWIVLIIAIILCVAYGIYYLIKRKKK